MTTSINNILISSSNVKVFGADIFLSSMSYGPLALPWFADYTHLIFWFFFLTSFILSVWLIQTFYFSVRSSESKFPIRETRGFSRAQTGDTLTAIIPMSWSITMLMHASTHSSNFDENTDSTSLSLTLIAYQWGWNYLFPSDIILNEFTNTFQTKLPNVKLNENSMIKFNLLALKYLNSNNINTVLTHTNNFFKVKEFYKITTKIYSNSIKDLIYSNTINNFYQKYSINNNIIYSNTFKIIKPLITHYIGYCINNITISNTNDNNLIDNNFFFKKPIIFNKNDAVSHLKKNNGIFTKTNLLNNNGQAYQYIFQQKIVTTQNNWFNNIINNTNEIANVFFKIQTSNNLIKHHNIFFTNSNNNKLNKFNVNYNYTKKKILNNKLYNFLPELGIDLTQLFFNSKFLIETSTTRQTNTLINPNNLFGGLVSRIRVTSGVILPSDVSLHLICGSKDVIHSWAIPGLGIKIDCIPGYNCHRRLLLRWRGLFWGQCMEVCGRYHHWMPILIRVSHIDYFILWLNSISNNTVG